MRRLAALGALLLTLPRPALADAQPVSLFMPSCELPGVNADELRKAVALELQSDGLRLSPSRGLYPEHDVRLWIEAACPRPDELRLRAERGTARQSRAFRLSELAPSQRSRALSLSLAELASLVAHPSAPKPTEADTGTLAETKTGTQTNDTQTKTDPEIVIAAENVTLDETETETVAVNEDDSKPPPAPAAPSPRAGSLARRRVPSLVSPASDSAWRIGLMPELRYFDRTALWGARAQLERARFRYAAGLLTAPSEATTGKVWTRLVHASAIYAVPLLGEAERSLLETGPRLGVGYTFLSVQANADSIGHDARDWYADLAWTLRFTAAVSRSVRLGLGAELGYGRGPIGYADNVVITQTSGPFASLLLQSSLSLGGKDLESQARPVAADHALKAPPNNRKKGL